MATMLSATERSDRRREALRTELVDRLLPVVKELLDGEESYLKLSVEQIIQRAGIARSTFYRYFEDKNELLLALAGPALDDIIAFSQLPQNLPPDATRADLDAAMDEVFDAYRPHIALMNAMVEVSAYVEPVKERFRAGFAETARALAEHIRHGQEEGYVRPGLEPKETAGWLVWMVERGMYELATHADEAELRRLKQSITDIVWYTLYDGQGRAEA